jgi:YHS domain-containing protein
MKTQVILASMLAFTLIVASVWAEMNLSAAKCMFSGKPAKESAAAEYNGGKVFFCCENCPAEFKKDPAKHAVKANHQLVATTQAKQTGCPFSGKAVAEGTAVKIDGVEVAFCCPNCQGKVAKAEAAEQAQMVFNDKAFAKGFKVGDAK